MVKNPLIKSVIVVTTTWWMILTVVAKEPITALSRMVLAFSGAIGGATLGFGAVFVLLFLGRRAAISNIKGTNNRGLSISMGTLPVGIGPPARAEGAVLEVDDTRLSQWYQEAKTKYPSHARLFEACLQVYARNYDLPASPVRGGHGGVALFNHALHVSEVALELRETWSHDGERIKKEDLRIPLTDPEYTFDCNDPLIPVLALAHDIGKIECYSEVDGKIKEFRQDHDMVSGLMLARTPETWRLDPEDRTDLLLAVSHYHHPSYLPTHASDRVRAMVSLLIAADVKASTIEGIPDIAKAWKELAEQPTERELIWEVFTDLIAAPGSINGQDLDNRIGYKNGSFLYLFEDKTRHAIAKAMGNERAAEKSSRMKDGRYKISDLLMQVLEDKDILYSTHKGKKYSHTKALFKVTFNDPRNPDHSVTVPAVIILKLGNPILSRFDKHPDSRLQPGNVEPLFSPSAGKPIDKAEADESAKDAAVRLESPVVTPPTKAQQAIEPALPKPLEAGNSIKDSKPKPRRVGKVIDKPVMSEHLIAQMNDPMKSLELLMQATEQGKKPPPPETVPTGVVQSIARIYASFDGGMVRYHDNPTDGFVYIKRDDVVEGMMTDEDRAWIENAKHPRIKFKASDKAKYLVIGGDFLKTMENTK